MKRKIKIRAKNSDGLLTTIEAEVSVGKKGMSRSLLIAQRKYLANSLHDMLRNYGYEAQEIKII